jgi:arabinofuranan 3-O-arabinosyltransferase
VFALIATTAGSLNGSSIFFVLAGAVLWLPYAVWGERSASVRTGLLILARLAALTFVTQLWWLVAYQVGGAYGLPVLQMTETVALTSVTTTAIEVLRGLGYWFFYGEDNLAPWLDGLAPAFAESLLLVVVSFVVPLGCLLLGWWSRFRERVYFLGLVVVGMVMSTIAFGAPGRSPVGTVFEALSRDSALVLSLRNTQRAAALVVLGLAGLAAAGTQALGSRRPALGRVAATVVVAAVLGTFLVPWSTALHADRYERPEDVPRAWLQTARYLDRVGGRAMLTPGQDFAAYRWGYTLDPVLTALTDTSVVWRELLPMGGAAGTELVSAYDGSLQEGRFDPRSIVPVARSLGVSHIVVANDLDVERYRLPRPTVVMRAFLDPAAGLRLVRTFGPGYVNRNPGVPVLDETNLRAIDSRRTRLPRIAVFEVPGVGPEPVTAYATGAETVVHGDAHGVVAAATAGLLDADHVPVLTANDLRTWPEARARVKAGNPRQIVTDTNRRQDRRFYTLRDNYGAVQTPAGAPRSGVPNDLPAEAFTDARARARSTAELRGVVAIDASGYGNATSLLPEERPSNAFDGDLRTSWRVDVASLAAFRDDRPHWLRIRLAQPVTADHVDIVQAQGRLNTEAVPAFEVVLDRDRVVPVTVDPSNAFTPVGIRVPLDGRPFTRLEIRIPGTDFVDAVGISEVRIPGVAPVEELVRMPRSLGTTARLDRPVPTAYVMTRLRANPREVVRMDPELALRRIFTVPAPTDFRLSGTARLAARAPDPVLDAVLGTVPPGTRVDTTERLIGDAASRGSAAVDGDLATAWTTPFTGVVGQRWTRSSDEPITVTEIPIDLVADTEHSVPTQFRLTVDDETQLVDVPAPAAEQPPGGTVRAALRPDRPLTGREVSLEITRIAPKFASDAYGNEVLLPAAVAEIGLGQPVATTARTVDTGCRTDLLAIDGRSVAIRIRGDATVAGDGPLAVQTCDGGPVTLTRGAHELRAAPGLDTGIDLDLVTLVSPDFAAAPGLDRAATPRVAARDVDRARIAPVGAPYWIRIEQSANPGWTASLRTGRSTVDLGPAHPLDAFAAGWLVDGAPSRPATLRVSWGPQRTVDVGLVVSALAALGCLVLIVTRRRGPSAVAAGPAPRLSTAPLAAVRVPVVATSAVVIGGLAVGGVRVGVALAAFVVVAALSRPVRWLRPVVRLAPLAALAGAVASVVVTQARERFDLSIAWPSYFTTAHTLAYVGVLALFVLLLGDRAEDDPSAPDRVEGSR